MSTSAEKGQIAVDNETGITHHSVCNILTNYKISKTQIINEVFGPWFRFERSGLCKEITSEVIPNFI